MIPENSIICGDCLEVMKDYNKYLLTKRKQFQKCGLKIKKKDINTILFDFQKDIVQWAVRKGND